MSVELEPFPLGGICASYLKEIEEELQSSFVKVFVRLIGKSEIAPKALNRLCEKIGTCLGVPKIKCIAEVVKNTIEPDSLLISAIMVTRNVTQQWNIMAGASAIADAAKIRETLRTTVLRQNAGKKLGEDAELVPFAGFTLMEILPEEDLTSKEVCEVYVKPKTASKKVPLIELLSELDADVVSGAGTSIIHAWSSPFRSIWQSLEPELSNRGDDPSEVFVWIDIFSISQHQTYNITPHWLTTTLCDALGTIGSSVLVLSDWTNPIPLKRAWCLWEILATIQQGIELAVIMPSSQRKSFDERVFHDLPTVIKATFDAIDSEHAQATNKNDEIQILSSIRDSIGFDGANLVTKDRLLEWLSMASEVTAKDPDRTRDHLATATFCYRLAKIMSTGQGKHAEATEMLRKAVDIRTVELGPNHELTIECSIALANVYRLQGKVVEAEMTLRKVCESMSSSKGPEHEDTILALATLSRVLVDRGNFEEAEKICEDTLAISESKFGLQDQRTLDMLVTLSQLADLRCDSDMAAQWLRKALEGFQAKLGSDAPQTLNLKADLAGFLAELENFDEAEALFKEASEKLTISVGAAHEWTIKANTGLSVLQKVKEALGPSYTPGKFASKAAVPPTIPETSSVQPDPVDLSTSTRYHATSVSSPQKKISFDPKMSQGANIEAVEEVAEKLTTMRENRHEKIKSNVSTNSHSHSGAASLKLRGWLEKLPIELSQREQERSLRAKNKKKQGSGLNMDNGSGLLNSSANQQAPPKPKSMLLKMASGIGSTLNLGRNDKSERETKRKSVPVLASFSDMNTDAIKLSLVNSKWTKRFFQAQSNQKSSALVYWLSEEDCRNGRDKRDDFPLDDFNSRIFETSPFGPLAFSITGPKGRLHLRAPSAEAKKEWIEGIKEALSFRGNADKAKLFDSNGEVPSSVEERKAFFTGSFVNMDDLLGQHSTILSVGEELLRKSLLEMEDD